jgi:hypothetical protein
VVALSGVFIGARPRRKSVLRTGVRQCPVVGRGTETANWLIVPDKDVLIGEVKALLEQENSESEVKNDDGEQS